MNQRAERRKKMRRSIRPVFDNPPGDRRRDIDRRGQPAVKAPAGAIRPAVNEEAPAVERRRVPGATE
jgi:hypothetical protein